MADVESASAGLALASRGMRFLAYIIDALIVSCVVYVPMIVTGDLREASALAVQTNNPMAIYGGFVGAGGLIGTVGFIVWAIITYRLVAANGQTIAKKLLGIKVVRSDGSKASVGRIFWLRNVVNG